MPLDTIKCLKIANGRVCSMKDPAKLDAFIDKNDLDQEKITFKNGTRSIVKDKNGDWKMTVLSYNGGQSYVLLGDKEHQE